MNENLEKIQTKKTTAFKKLAKKSKVILHTKQDLPNTTSFIDTFFAKDLKTKKAICKAKKKG